MAGREQVDLFNVSAGTTLRVTPHVFRDREQTRIKLLVNVEDGNITNRQVDQIPVVERSTVNTQALIAEGESLLIGGMVRETQSSSEDKVPGLGDVPVVGNLFKTKTSGTTRVERMFLITPRMAGTRAANAAGHARHAALRPDAGDACGSPTPSPAPAPLPGLQTSAPPAAAAPARVRRAPHRRPRRPLRRQPPARDRAADSRVGGGRPRRDARPVPRPPAPRGAAARARTAAAPPRRPASAPRKPTEPTATRSARAWTAPHPPSNPCTHSNCASSRARKAVPARRSSAGVACVLAAGPTVRATAPTSCCAKTSCRPARVRVQRRAGRKPPSKCWPAKCCSATRR